LRMQRCKPTKKFVLDTTKLKDGHHELRIVARENTPIETQGRLIANVIIKNGRNAIELTANPRNLSLASKQVVVNVLSTTKTPVQVFCNGLELGSLPTGSGALRIATKKLGSGTVVLYAESEGLRSKPFQVDITP